MIVARSSSLEQLQGIEFATSSRRPTNVANDKVRSLIRLTSDCRHQALQFANCNWGPAPSLARKIARRGARRVIYWPNLGRILFTCWVTRPIQFHLHESRTDSLVSTHDRSVSREPYLLGPNLGRLVSQSLHHCTPILPCTSFRRHEGECRRVAVVEHVERPVDTQTLVLCTPVACPAHRHPLPLRLGSGSSRKYRIVVKTLRSPLGPQVASELSW